MMKKHLLMKTLLVALVCLVGGTSSVWAAPTGNNVLSTATGIVGPKDNSSAAFIYGSKPITIAAGETYELTFVNHNAGSGKMFYNWILEGNNGTQYFDFRPDGGYWGGIFDAGAATNSYTGNTHTDVSGVSGEDDDAWQAAYNGVTVTLTATRSNDGATLTFTHSATTNTSVAYSGTFTVNLVNASSTINFYITNEKSHQVITKVVKNGTQFNFASSESAYTDQANATTNYNGTTVDNLKLYYTQYRDWGTSDGTVKVNASGKMSFYKFDLTDIKNKLTTDGGTITGVTFSVYGNGDGGDCGKVRILGYNPVWSSSTITNATVTNNAGTIPGTVSGTGSFQPLNTTSEMTLPGAGTTLTANALAYVNSAIAAGQDYVTIAMAANYTRTGLLKTWADLEFTYTAAVVYEATFVETNSLNPTVTVYTDAERTSPIEKNELEANTTYYYKAVLAGYENYEGSFAVETSDPVVNFTMTSLPRYTFTVNAVNSVGSSVIEAIYTDDDSYDGKTHNVYFPKYLTGTGNIVTFSKDDATYYQQYTSVSGDATKSVSYTAYDGVAYFFEGESYASLGTKETNANYSNGRAGRGLDNGTMDVATIPVSGNYDITYAICSSNVGTGKETQFSFYRNNSGNVVIDVTNLNHSVTNVKTTGTQTVNNITFAAGDVLQFYAKGTKVILDYVLVKLATIPVEVTAAGFATYVNSDYDLDFSATEIEAYKVKVSSKGVATLTKVNNVPAGTPVLLYKNGGKTENIPVMTGAAAVTENDLVAGTGAAVATTVGDYTNMILNNIGGNVGFYFANGQTVAANRAYLHFATTLAPDPATARMTMIFEDDDVTGVNEVRSQKEDVRSEWFDLQGRKVAQPQKGLYIVNGKKIVLK